MLSVCFACTKFHNYIYGNKIKIFNDHQPLLSIIKKDLHKIKNNRLHRLRLSILEYLVGSKMFILDLLSRNYIKNNVIDDVFRKDVVHTVTENTYSMSEERFKQFQYEKAKDIVLGKILRYYQNGLPTKNKLSGELEHLYTLKDSLSVENGIIYTEDKMIIPQSLRKYTLTVMHETHLGFEKIKSMAKNNVYWPAMNSDIKNFVSRCNICAKYSKSKKRSSLMSHEIPNIPFYKIGADIADMHRTV